MIDWLTLKAARELLDADTIYQLEDRAGRMLCIDRDGSLKWERIEREQIRSDSHQISIFMGPYDLEIYGSPARVLAGNNVFGPGCPVECATAMLDFVQAQTGCTLPGYLQFRATRVDVTQNYDLGSAAEVRQALNVLRMVEGGHYQVSSEDLTVYYNKRSSLRAGKAYAKGQHLRMQDRKRQAEVEGWQLDSADRLLRLELALRSQFWRERASKEWYEYSEHELHELHEQYFRGVIGEGLEITEMDSLREKFIEVAETEGRGLAAYATWCRIKVEGLREVQESFTKNDGGLNATWYKHRKIMFAAGLSWADLKAGNVVPFRRRAIHLGSPVTSWEELRRAA